MNVVVIGSINMDYTVKVKELPKREETVLATSFHVAAGGKGANQAVAARRLGADVLMIGALGNDSMGKELKEQLEKEGIDVSGINFVDKPTGNAMITVDDNGSNTIVVYQGSNSELDIKWIKKYEDKIKNCDYVILQLEIPIETVYEAVKLAKKLNRKIILNPAPAKDIPEEIYKYVDIVTPNETELATLTGIKDIKKGAEELLRRGAKSVIVTLGDEGSYYLDSEVDMKITPIKVNALDTTAAGDSFNGALAVALCEGKDMRSALEFANKVGALTTTKIGAQISLPFREEVDRLF